MVVTDQKTGRNHENGVGKSEDYIRSAVAAANPNALRLALFQLTDDRELEQLNVSKKGVRGGAMQDFILSEEDANIVRSKAVEFLLLREQKQQNVLNWESQYPIPTKQESVKLMEMFHGEPLDPLMIDLGYEELSFDENPRATNWTTKPPADKIAKYHVVIIGAGINGIAAAVALQRLGIKYTVIDRQKDTGGTWMANTYPEARVDTLGFTFKYKFQRRYAWKEMFPSAPDIRQYLETVATTQAVKKNFMFEREVRAAQWEESSQTWRLTLMLPDGTTEYLTTHPNAIISACGLFASPNLPNIKGLEDYKGHIFHTTQWDHTIGLKNRSIAVIGNGSSGAQLIPGLAREAATLGVYQRTPQWMAPYDGYRSPVPDSLNWLLAHMPFFENWNGYAGYIRSMQLAPLQVDDPGWRAKGGLVNARNDKLREDLTKYIKAKVGENSPLVPHLVPKYAPLVRRLVVDNGFYDALNRDNVELITSPIDRMVADGIRTMDGKERQFDTIVLACGFQPTNYLHPVTYTGRNGVTLDQTWAKDGARSYLGLTIPGYPNLFTMYGPNHQPRGGPSIHSWAEIWARYAATAIVHMIENNIRSMEVKQSVYEEYNDALDAETKKLIWEAEGRGYFVNRHGRQAVNLPWTTDYYHSRILKPDIEDFNVSK